MGERSGGTAGEEVGRVAILGLGASGTAAARLALEKGGEVHVSDLRTDTEVAAAGDELRARGADVELGFHDASRIAAADTVVVSPGISPDAPVLAELRERGVRWISEPEFAFRFLPGALIAVTGTNGKTTTAVLAAHLLETGGYRVGLGGNVGADFGPAASLLALEDPAPEWCVVEVSSFQLAAVDRFRPDIGVVTSLAPDHLDRYDSVESYYADKARLFENATPESRWVLADDPAVQTLAGDAPGRRFRFSHDPPGAGPERGGSAESGSAGSRSGFGSGSGSAGPAPAGEGWSGGGWIEEDVLVLDVGKGTERLLPAADLPLLGRHNRTNALAAALAARLAGVGADVLAGGLRSFEAVPHRLEAVGERDGILWVNDSKATNVSAAVEAVRSLGRPLVVLLGGKDKGEDLAPLRRALETKAARRELRAVVLYGAARDRLEEALRSSAGPAPSGRPGELPLRAVDGGLDAAVAESVRHALAGDAILLAPACSSFDEFRDYRERGERFRALAGGAS